MEAVKLLNTTACDEFGADSKQGIHVKYRFRDFSVVLWSRHCNQA
jgi:hypothetical protein